MIVIEIITFFDLCDLSSVEFVGNVGFFFCMRFSVFFKVVCVDMVNIGRFECWVRMKIVLSDWKSRLVLTTFGLC